LVDITGTRIVWGNFDYRPLDFALRTVEIWEWFRRERMEWNGGVC